MAFLPFTRFAATEICNRTAQTSRGKRASSGITALEGTPLWLRVYKVVLRLNEVSGTSSAKIKPERILILEGSPRVAAAPGEATDERTLYPVGVTQHIQTKNDKSSPVLASRSYVDIYLIYISYVMARATPWKTSKSSPRRLQRTSA